MKLLEELGTMLQGIFMGVAIAAVFAALGAASAVAVMTVENLSGRY